MITTLKTVTYCAEEVARQMDGPLEVQSMVSAWVFAEERQKNGQRLSVDLIREIGILVHPWTNRDGFRRHSIAVGAEQIGVEPYDLRTKLERLVRAIAGTDAFEFPLPLLWRKDIKVKTSFKTIDREPGPDLTPESYSYDNVLAVMAYYNFEKIHPFGDGNGRTGKIILNWLNDSLESPVMPPNFWDCSNP